MARRSKAAEVEPPEEEPEPEAEHDVEELASYRPRDRPVDHNNFKFRITGTSVTLQMVRKKEDVLSKAISNRNVRDNIGHTLVIAHEAFAVTTYFKYRRKEGTLSIFVDGGEGPVEIATYERGWETP